VCFSRKSRNRTVSITIIIAEKGAHVEQCVYILLCTAVVGCANPTMQLGMKMSRNGDVITISCDVSSDVGRAYDQLEDAAVWQMTCVRNQWVGSYGNCSDSKNLKHFYKI